MNVELVQIKMRKRNKKHKIKPSLLRERFANLIKFLNAASQDEKEITADTGQLHMGSMRHRHFPFKYAPTPNKEHDEEKT